MLQYSIRRLLYIIPVLLGVCGIVFILYNVVADDPAVTLLGKHPTAEQVAELRKELGLDKSYFLQYVDIVKSAFTFDFGRSWSSQQKISEIISNKAGASLSLTVPAFIISLILGISLSLIVSFYRGRAIDNFIRTVSIAMMSISYLVYIIIFQYFFAFEWSLFEISGYESGFPAFIPYVALPVLISVVTSLGPDIRFFRTIMLDEIYQDYVRTARAKGLSEKVILFKHVLRNALVPIITYIVIQIPFLILGALLLESFFDIPGLGGELLRAINSNDFPVIKAYTILTAIALIVFGLITDLLYAFVDPRIKLQ